jgi:shikimate dehydrogenase
VDLNIFTHLEGVLDIVYNPARTQLLLDAEQRSLVAMNGLWMLVAQAKESAEWFSGHSISDDQIAAIHRQLKTQMENIILIGVPGSGKSTIGQALAQKLNRRFVDADAAIVEKAGMSIPEIFALQGEDGFRRLESQVLADLGKQSAFVIATGGGCVTRDENYHSLHQNGTIFCLNRDLQMLPTDGRPLSKTGKLEEMYRIRKPLYDRFADYQIDNNGDAYDAVRQIQNILEDNP